MELWSELFSSWAGIASLASIIFMIGMAGFILWFVLKKSRESK